MDVSVLICTYNSALRLPQTLSHLRQQRTARNLSWELVIVDFASSDGTLAVAREQWRDEQIPLICLTEHAAGKSPALATGLRAASGEAVCIVDDDNWVAEDYVATAYEIITKYPEVGVIGARGEAACEIEPPWWFDSLRYMYAVGPQAPSSGFVGSNCFSFWGAGCVLRRSAWDAIVNSGFRPIFNPSRSDGINFNPGFTGGEDPEMCLAIQLAGYRLWFEDRLRYKHWIPAARLTPEYIEKTAIGVNMASPILKLYQAKLRPAIGASYCKQKLMRSWGCHYAMAAAGMMIAVVAYNFRPSDIIERKRLSAYRGQLRGLWYWRKGYRAFVARIDALERAAALVRKGKAAI